jgi:hypothetical protein
VAARSACASGRSSSWWWRGLRADFWRQLIALLDAVREALELDCPP